MTPRSPERRGVTGRRRGRASGSTVAMDDRRGPKGFFSDPRPDPAAVAVIEAGFRQIARLAPDARELRDRFVAPTTVPDRELFLDAAAALLSLADRSWASGRVLEALALEGLEARLLEQIVCP
jgi:hypothetical protein